KVGSIEIKNALLLAPMEDVTDISFRNICKGFGADVVYTEFVNSEGLIRSVEKTHKKLKITESERPVGIQIYGESLESMVSAARIAAEENPDILDVNAGCWVKKVANRGAGAGLLKDPPYLQKMVKEIVNAVNIPVTVKTRIGWDQDSIMITEIAKRLEDVGIKALTIHCRTRQQGHSGDADWEWIDKVKEVVSIPVVLNGGVFTAEDVKKVFDTTKADGVMIARGAIANPWIFQEAKEILSQGYVSLKLNQEVRIMTALSHLKESIEIKGERRAVLEFRKYYSSYLKGLYGVSQIRQEMMKFTEYQPIEERLLRYLEELNNYSENPTDSVGESVNEIE
ncbi:MAG: tRNA dihydrouridine synthase DusB, partial [Bacillota bacterium]